MYNQQEIKSVASEAALRQMPLPKDGEEPEEEAHVLLVEDHAAFRDALAVMLNRQPDLEVAAQCGSLAECRSLGDDFADIDVALLDLLLPDGDGTQLIGVLREADPHVKVLILTASPEAGLLERMAEAGADGVLDKTSGLKEIAAEVRRLASGPIDNES